MSKLIRAGIVLVAVLALAPASAAPIEDHRVFTDNVNDGDPLAPDATPMFQDLIAGYITETDTTMEFTWQVVDIDDIITNRFALFHWEFAFGESASTVVPCDAEGNRCFTVRAGFGEDGTGLGALESNCAGSPVVECELLDAEVTVTIDADSNAVTASVLRADIGEPADGEIMMEPTTPLFRGIAAFTRLGLPWGGEASAPAREALAPVNEQSPLGLPPSFVCSCVMDDADLDDFVYIVGSNVA